MLVINFMKWSGWVETFWLEILAKNGVLHINVFIKYSCIANFDTLYS